MTQSDVSSPRAATVGTSRAAVCPTGRWWVSALLGLVMIAAGIFVLLNVVLASLAAALWFAAALIVAGAVEIVHAFSARGWKSVVWSVLTGILFVAGGVLLATNPLATSLGLTLGIAAIMLGAGIFRVVLAFRHWHDFGWLMLISGLFGIAFGVVLFLGFPWSGLVVPGLLLGVDLLFDGAWWLTVGLFVRRRPDEGSIAAQPATLAG